MPSSKPSPGLDSPEAARELTRRRRARRGLLDFTRYTMPGFQPGAHHKTICDALDRVERGECKRLIICAPPRHTKSEMASRRFPAMYLGRNPDHQLITATYAQDFANDFGLDVRQIVQSPAYRDLFRLTLREDSQAKAVWRTSQGGIYVAVGVGGPITGRGAHLAIVDDPFKNRADADSPVIREKVWRWYTSTLRTRMMPGGAIVLICTRWHEDDLAGRLLKAAEEGGEPWEVVSLPAVTKDAQGLETALWEDWYPLTELHKLRDSIGGRDWNSLYQQRPTAEEGDFFEKAWFRRYRQAPAVASIYMTGDFALTPDGGDSSEIGVWGVDSLDNYYCLDWWDGRTEPDAWIAAMLSKIERWKPLRFIGEAGPIRRATEPTIRRQMREKRLGCALEWLPTGAGTRDVSAKAVNARPFRDLLLQGRVYFPNLPWAERVIDQLLRFPGGAEDDAVDTCSNFGRFIHKTWAAAPPAPAKPALEEAWNAPLSIASFAQRTRKSW